MRCGNPRDVASKAAASGDFALDGSDGGSGGGGGSGTSKKTGEESGDDDEEESFIEGMQKRICEFFGKFFENVALAIMVYKGLFALIYAWRYMCSKIDYDNDACTYWYDLTRITLGRGILLGLEFLLISDIIETMVHGANTTSLINIGLVAIIRTMIDFFMAKEVSIGGAMFARKDVMEEHVRRKHKGEVQSQKPPSMLGFFQKSTEPVPASNTNTVDSSTNIAETEGSKRRRVSNSAVRQAASRNALITVSPSVVVRIFSIFTILNSMNVVENEVHEAIKVLPALIAKEVAQDLSNTAVSKSSSLLDMNMRSCTTIEAVYDKFEMRQLVDVDTIVCPCCYQHARHAPMKICRGHNRDTVGTFRTSGKFKNLKASVLHQHKSAVHEWCAEYENQRQLEAIRVQDVGMTI
eukprot:gene8786-10413_t